MPSPTRWKWPRRSASAGVSVVTDTRNEKINAKIREHSLQHVPVIAVVGRKEAADRTVALRRLGGQAQEILSLDAALDGLAAEAVPPDITRSGTPDREFA